MTVKLMYIPAAPKHARGGAPGRRWPMCRLVSSEPLITGEVVEVYTKTGAAQRARVGALRAALPKGTPPGFYFAYDRARL